MNSVLIYLRLLEVHMVLIANHTVMSIILVLIPLIMSIMLLRVCMIMLRPLLKLHQIIVMRLKIVLWLKGIIFRLLRILHQFIKADWFSIIFFGGKIFVTWQKLSEIFAITIFFNVRWIIFSWFARNVILKN